MLGDLAPAPGVQPVGGAQEDDHDDDQDDGDHGPGVPADGGPAHRLTTRWAAAPAAAHRESVRLRGHDAVPREHLRVARDRAPGGAAQPDRTRRPRGGVVAVVDRAAALVGLLTDVAAAPRAPGVPLVAGVAWTAELRPGGHPVAGHLL